MHWSMSLALVYPGVSETRTHARATKKCACCVRVFVSRCVCMAIELQGKQAPGTLVLNRHNRRKRRIISGIVRSGGGADADYKYRFSSIKVNVYMIKVHTLFCLIENKNLL